MKSTIISRRLFNIFNLMRSKSKTLTMSQMTVLSYIAQCEDYGKPVSIIDIANDLNLKGHSSAARLIETLSSGYFRGKKNKSKFYEGLHLVDKRWKFSDPREYSLTLTKKGREFLNQTHDLMNRNLQ